MPPKNRASDHHPVFTLITDWANKIIPLLIVSSIAVICGGAWVTYDSVNKLVFKTESHDARLNELQATYAAINKLAEVVSRHDNEISVLRAEQIALRSELKVVAENAVRRMEILELIKRVEQQMEIALLRAGVKIPPKIMSSELSK